jgi:hypothetical protein
MSRFRFSEINLNRLGNAIARRAFDFPHNLAWKLAGKENREKLASFKDIYRGKRGFILANGPTLTSLDLSRLKGEITIGMNRIYLLFDRLDFQPNYYVAINDLVLNQYAEDIKRLAMPKFLNWNLRRNFAEGQYFFLRLRLSMRDHFERDIRKPLSSGGTVTYAALQLAHYLGFQDVILIGLDHSFDSQGTPNMIETRRSGEDKNHFHPDYFPSGTKWMLPDLRRSELAYAEARREFERDGRRILDATPGGKCPVFERVEYESLFRSDK